MRFRLPKLFSMPMTQTAGTGYHITTREGDGYEVIWEFWPRDPPILMAILLRLERQVLPAVRQTQGSKFADKRAVAYNKSQEGFQKWVWGIRFKHDIPTFGADDKLAMTCEIALPAKTAKAADWDNLGKAVSDGLQDRKRGEHRLIGLYPNDKNIWDGRAVKVLLADGDEPWVRVEIRRLE